MSKIAGLMDTGRRAMMNSQTALQTVGHNIANKTTEGYSRQRVEMVANDPVSHGGLRIGTGAKAAKVTRINNPYIEKQIEKESSSLGYNEARAGGLDRVEQIYNEQANKGVNHYISEFFNAYRELSNYPESTATRTLVRESAQALANDFNRVGRQLEAVQEDLDLQITVQAEEINQITAEIANLNQKVQSVEISGAPANDERDRREVLLKKLGEKLNINYAEGDHGSITVTAGRGAILVSGYDNYQLKATNTAERGRTELMFVSPGGSEFKVTEQITGGALGGALQVRDQFIEEMKTSMDELAYDVALEVNRAHIQGYDAKGNKGVLLFEMPEDVKGAASSFRVNKTILEDANRIVSGAKPNAPADNTVANVISSLQNKQLMREGTATFDDFYNSSVGQVGVIAQRAHRAVESQKNIVQQLQNIRESISGVSLDEEATKMIEFQRSFDASARLIRAADEMFDTIINIKRY